MTKVALIKDFSFSNLERKVMIEFRLHRVRGASTIFWLSFWKLQLVFIVSG